MRVRHTLWVVLASAAVGSIARADLPPSQGRDVPVSEEAKKYFKSGVDFLKDPDGARYEEAYSKFRAAYQISPSWRILGNLALSAMKLERFGEAIEAYERYVAEGGNDVDKRERAQIDTDLRQMKLSSATVTVAVPSSGDAVVLDQRLRANGTSALNSYTALRGRQLKLMVAAGHHVLTAKADGKESRWEADLAAEKPSDHTFTFESAAPATPAPIAAPAPILPASTFAAKTEAEPSSSSGVRTAGFVAAGVGGALLVGGVITGLIGKSKLSSLEESCPNNRCTADKQNDADSVHSLQTTTNVLLIGGGVLAAAGVTMVLVGAPSKSATAAKSAPFSFALAPAPAGIVAAGQF